MKLNAFFRFIIPLSYFQFSRLNSWTYAGYHALLEWIPVIAVSFYYSSFDPKVFLVLGGSYIAFICIYEIGYLFNDFYSERFESDSRQRSKNVAITFPVLLGLGIVRLAIFVLLTYLLGGLNSYVWWTFFLMLAVTFLLHNVRPKESRTSTFFCLATFRFCAPLLLCVSQPVFLVVLLATMLNYSLFRLMTYGKSKGLFIEFDKAVKNFQSTFFVNCVPLNIFIAVFTGSFLPIVAGVYYLLIWTGYNIVRNRSAVTEGTN